jgi:SAM-dependent methyltransferase
MSPESEQAGIEVRIDWEDGFSRHRNRDHFEKINFWRDILPGSLSMTLPASQGEWVSEDFSPGEIVPPWSERNIHRIKRSDLQLRRKNGPAIHITAGRHYPRYIAAGTADIHAGNFQPLRVTTMDDDSVTVDLNHPLSRFPLTVSARITERLGPASEHGGRCNDIAMDTMKPGVGLECVYPSDEMVYLNSDNLDRMDNRSDAMFYETVRLVQHIDRTAIEQITAFYRQNLGPDMKVLDFMSSWVSHLPDDIAGLSVTGLGMNTAELEKNPQLSGHVTHDVNANPGLPFEDNSFDAVVCTVSVEYLVQPVAVFRELGRILKPGGIVLVTFSDRWFPTKVISVWTELHPFERLAMVQAMIRAAGCFTALGTETVHGLPRPEDDKYAQQRALSDPVFAASARTVDR